MQCKYIKDKVYRVGIVYHEYVIDLMSGAPFRIKDIYNEAQINNIDLDDAIIEWMDWKDLSKGL